MLRPVYRTALAAVVARVVDLHSRNFGLWHDVPPGWEAMPIIPDSGNGFGPLVFRCRRSERHYYQLALSYNPPELRVASMHLRNVLRSIFALSSRCMRSIRRPVTSLISRLLAWRPKFPHSQARPEGDIHRVQYAGLRALRFGVLCQVILALLGGSVWFYVGGPLGPFVAALVTSITLWGLADYRFWREVQSETVGKVGGCLAWLFWVGVPCILLTSVPGLKLVLHVGQATTQMLLYTLLVIV